MYLSEEDILIVKRLIDMWGWEHGDLKSEDIIPLAKKLEMKDWLSTYD